MSVGGPLKDVRVLEFAGVGPGPFCGMMLSDLGADVVRIERADAADPTVHDFDARGRRSLALDLKDPASTTLCLALAARAELLFEGFRPGVMERLGLGPDLLLARNPALIYGRVTGWGQTGPYAQRAGHDLDYASLTGAVHAIGGEQRPAPPLNLVADYGGGAMFLMTGLLAGLLHARTSGEGQVIDVAMSDGVAYLMTVPYMLRAKGQWRDERRSNLLDGGAPFYDTYRCADGNWIALAPLEPQFFAALARALDLPDKFAASQYDTTLWPELRARLEALFLERTRDRWCEIFEEVDACLAPVLTMGEAPDHRHNVARGAFRMVGAAACPAPAPRFSRTPATVQHEPLPIGAGIEEALARWGLDPAIAATAAGSAPSTAAEI